METIIRMALRALALLIAASVVLTVMFVIQFARHGGLQSLRATGAFAVMTFAGWIATLLIGPFAAIQLLRLRNSGRIAAAVFFGMLALYYAVGALVYRSPDAPVMPIAITALSAAACMGILLTPLARHVCRRDALAE